MKSNTPRSDAIFNKYESLYLDNGGCLTHEQRDAAFVEALALARELEAECRSLHAFKRSVDEALNSGDGAYRP